MAVREFNGTSDRIVCDNGIIGQLANGAFTMLCLARPLTLSGNPSILGPLNGSNWIAVLQTDGAGGALDLTDDNDFCQIGSMNVNTTTWQIIVVTCSAPGAAPRFHRKQLGSGVWTRQSSGTNFNGNTFSAATVEFGSSNNGAFSSFWNGRLAVAAIWNSVLSDGTLDTIESTATTQGIYSTSPQGLWEFNQSAVTTDVTDLTNNGANQTTRSGTTVVNGDDPTWTFGLEPAAAWCIRAL